VFVPKGSPHAHFQRSIERGHLLSAETAARHLPRPIALADALALLLLIAVEPRYSRAAARWHGRFVVECGLSLEDDALALAALSAVRFSPAALELLEELGRGNDGLPASRQPIGCGAVYGRGKRWRQAQGEQSS
jgi:hypothetical protein